MKREPCIIAVWFWGDTLPPTTQEPTPIGHDLYTTIRGVGYDPSGILVFCRGIKISPDFTATKLASAYSTDRNTQK